MLGIAAPGRQGWALLLGLLGLLGGVDGQGTCDNKQDGSSGGAVTNAECAAAGGSGGLFATAGATGTCNGSPCDMTVTADATACCTACSAVSNAAGGSTVTCTSATTSRVSACNTGYWKDGSGNADVCTACTAVTNADGGATVTCTSASNTQVTACATGYFLNEGSSADTCDACTTQSGCTTHTSACSTDQASKYVCTAVTTAGTHYLGGTGNQISHACAAIANSAGTVTCTSGSTSRTTACSTGYRRNRGRLRDTCVDTTTGQHFGTMQGALTLSASASAIDNYYVGWTIVTATPADSGIVTGYDGATKVVTVTLAGGGTTTSSSTYTLYQYTGGTIHGGSPSQTGQMTAAKTLAADSSPTDDFYNGWTITTTNPTDTGLITDYVAATKVITVSLEGGGTTSASTTYILSAYPSLVITAQDQSSASITTGSYNDATTVTFTFTLSVAPAAGTAFEFADIAATNCDGTSISGSGTAYTLACSASNGNTITVQGKAGAFSDSNRRPSEVSSVFEVHSDTAAPTVSITASDQTGVAITDNSKNDATTITYTFTLSETPVTNLFLFSDLSMSSNCDGTAIAGSGLVWTTTCSGTDGQTYTAAVGASAFTDAAGNGNAGSATVTVISDRTAPTVTITATDQSSNAISTADYSAATTITFSFALSEAPASGTAFTLSDIEVTNCATTTLERATVAVASIDDGAANTITLSAADSAIVTGSNIRLADAPSQTCTATPKGSDLVVSSVSVAVITLTTDLTAGDGSASTNCVVTKETHFTLECPAVSGSAVSVAVGSPGYYTDDSRTSGFSDAAGNSNAAAAAFVVNSDTVVPTVTITATDQAGATIADNAVNDASTVTFTFALSESPVTNMFLYADVTSANCGGTSAINLATFAVASIDDGAANTIRLAAADSTIVAGANIRLADAASQTCTATPKGSDLVVASVSGDVITLSTDLTAGDGSASTNCVVTRDTHWTLACAASDGNAITAATSGSTFTDVAGNNNAASSTYTVHSDTTAPTLTITAADQAASSISTGATLNAAATAITFTFTLSELPAAGDDLAESELTVSNCNYATAAGAQAASTFGPLSSGAAISSITHSGAAGSDTITLADANLASSISIGSGTTVYLEDAPGRTCAVLPKGSDLVVASVSGAAVTLTTDLTEGDSSAATNCLLSWLPNSMTSGITARGCAAAAASDGTVSQTLCEGKGDGSSCGGSTYTSSQANPCFSWWPANCDYINGQCLPKPAKYTLTCAPNSAATISVAGNSGAITDTAGNANAATSAFTVSTDTTVPTVTITATDAASSALTSGAISTTATITFTFTLSQTSADFVQGDVSVTNCASVSWSAGPPATLECTTSASSNGVVSSVQVAGGLFTNSVGNSNASPSTTVCTATSCADSMFTVDIDRVAPTTTVTVADAAGSSLSHNDNTNTNKIIYTFVVSELAVPLTGFAYADLDVSNCDDPLFQHQGHTKYTLTCNSKDAGAISVAVKQGTSSVGYVDAAGNYNDPTCTTTCTAVVINSDVTAPTVAITANDGSSLASGASSKVTGTASGGGTMVTFTLTVSEATTDFVLADVTKTCVNAAWTAVSATVYTITCDAADGTDMLISVAAGVLSDAAGNKNPAAGQFAVASDLTAPTVTITASDDAFATTLSTNQYSIKNTLTWKFTLSEPPNRVLVVGDATISTSNCVNPLWTGSGLIYYLRCDGTAASATAPATGTPADITVQMAASRFTDKAGTDNTAGTALTVKSDTAPPTVTITANDGAAKTHGSISKAATVVFTFTVSEDSADFVKADVTTSGCSQTTSGGTGWAVTTANTVFALTCDSNDGNDISVSLAAGVLTDAGGNTNAAVSAFIISSDTTGPSITLTASDDAFATTLSTNAYSQKEVITWKFTLSELASTALAIADVTTKTNCVNERFTGGQTGLVYLLECDSNTAADGTAQDITVEMAASRFTDYATNDNTASNTLVVKSDSKPPTVTITASDSGVSFAASGGSSQIAGAAAVTFTFTVSEDTTDFVKGDLTQSGCTQASGTGWTATSATVYKLECDAADGTDMVMALAAGVLTDAAGNGNAAASSFTVTSYDTAPTVTTAAADAAGTSISTGGYTGTAVVFTFTLSKSSSDFELADVTHTNCDRPTFAGVKATYTLTCAYKDGATVSVQVEASKFTAHGGKANTAQGSAFTVVFT